MGDFSTDISKLMLRIIRYRFLKKKSLLITQKHCISLRSVYLVNNEIKEVIV